MRCALVAALLLSTSLGIAASSAQSITQAPVSSFTGASAPLSHRERRSLLRHVRPDMRATLRENFEDDLALAEEEADDERAMRFRHFAGPGGTITVLHAFDLWHCGATGNCAAWIFGPGDRLLFRGEHPRRISALPTSHHGLPDLVYSFHDSASETLWMWLRFDGHRYLRLNCLTRTVNDIPTRSVAIEHISCSTD